MARNFKFNFYLIEGGVEMGYANLDANAAQQTGVVLGLEQCVLIASTE